MSTDESLTPGAPLRPGMLVAGRYLLVEKLGGGGMGEVFLAEDKRLQRPIALKRLLPHLVDQPDLVQRSEREGQILARLNHAAINRVFDMVDSPDGGKFLILEYVHGRSFAAELRAVGRLPWNRCAEIGIQVCGALTAAHAEGVVHRDIKPANILMKDSDGSVHVADFGIAHLSSAQTIANGGSVIGTPDYWAPEQATGAETTASSDLYSLCCVLFEAVCGRPPYVADRGASTAAGFLMHVTQPVPDPRRFVPDLPEAACTVLMRGLEKDPAERYPSAAALAEALAGSRVVEPPPPPPAPEPPPPTPEPPPIAAEADPETATSEANRAPETVVPQAEPAPAAAPVAAGRAASTVVAPSPRNQRTVLTPEAATPSSQPSRPRRRLVPVAVGVVAALILGVGAGTMSAPTDTPAAPPPVVIGGKEIAAGHLVATAPSDWIVRDAGAARAAPFDLRNAMELRPRGAGAAQSILIGTSSATGPALLPDPLAKEQRDGVVAMGDLTGYRYTGIRAGGRPVSAFVAPATDGVPTVICPAAPGAGATACAAVVGSLALKGAKPFPLGPGPEQTKALRAVIGTVNSALLTASTIGKGSTAAAQGATARETAVRLRRALAAIPGAGDASPAVLPALAELRGALTAMAAGYDGLASAGSTVSASGWSEATAAVAAASPRLRQALAELGRAGYSAR